MLLISFTIILIIITLALSINIANSNLLSTQTRFSDIKIIVCSEIIELVLNPIAVSRFKRLFNAMGNS